MAVKKRLARQRVVNGSVDLAGAGGLISDSHAQRKAMFLKQRNVSHNQRTQDEQGTHFLVCSNRLLMGHMGPPKIGLFHIDSELSGNRFSVGGSIPAASVFSAAAAAAAFKSRHMGKTLGTYGGPPGSNEAPCDDFAARYGAGRRGSR